MTINTACKEFAARIFGSPERDRLAGAIAETEIDLNNQICSAGAKAQDCWKPTATQFLAQAKKYLEEWNIQQGWVALMSAQRAILSNPNNSDRVRRAAVVLRRELDKVTGWRAKAIEDLLCGLKDDYCKDSESGKDKDTKGTAKHGEGGEPDKDGASTAAEADAHKRAKDETFPPEMCERVIDAIALRDDYANTAYFRILLRRRSLVQLFLVLSLGIGVFASLAFFGKLPEPFQKWKEIAAVIVFGTLGACLSVGQGLLAANLSARIPSQQIGSVVVWMRPAIGAAAALIAYALIYANAQLDILSDRFSPDDFSVVAVIAFVAGYSERFIVGAIERISQLSDKDKDKDG